MLTSVYRKVGGKKIDYVSHLTANTKVSIFSTLNSDFYSTAHVLFVYELDAL